MKKMKIARLDTRIQFFHTDGFLLDESGNLMPKWQPFKKKWANAKHVVSSNDEHLGSGGNVARIRSRLELRYTKEITNEMSFYYDNHVFDIQSVGDLNGLKKTIVIFGEVLVNGGRN